MLSKIANFLRSGSTMDKSLLVALVAAATSTLVAIVGLIAATMTNRRSKTDEFADAALSATLEALKQGMRAIQNLKDEIQLILSSIEDSLDSQEAVSRLDKARDSLADTFGENHPHLDKIEALALHTAKGAAFSVSGVVQAGLRGKMYASDIPASARTKLLELRSQLTDQQNVLRDSRTDRIARRTLKSKLIR
jgi:hypothetical protein